MKARIYHNPHCGNSRGALQLLTERGAEVEIIEYLRDPPSRSVLERLRRELGVPVLAMVRTKEPEYRAAIAAGHGTSDAELLDLLAAQPKLLQRPIVEIGNRAVIGRPPERVLELL
jgi:arsenate reductase (glutaredoxin)